MCSFLHLPFPTPNCLSEHSEPHPQLASMHADDCATSLYEPITCKKPDKVANNNNNIRRNKKKKAAFPPPEVGKNLDINNHPHSQKKNPKTKTESQKKDHQKKKTKKGVGLDPDSNSEPSQVRTDSFHLRACPRHSFSNQHPWGNANQQLAPRSGGSCPKYEYVCSNYYIYFNISFYVSYSF